MSKFTTQVRYICETAAGLAQSVGASNVDTILEASWEDVLCKTISWPIYDESHRKELCKKILAHYYTREIGYETVGLWKLEIGVRLSEIMPYYNELYKSAAIEYDPLKEVDYTRTSVRNLDGTDKKNRTKNRGETGTSKDTGTTSENTSGTASGSSSLHTETSENSRVLNSDTPQGSVKNLEDMTYLSNAALQSGNGTNTNSGTNESSSTGEKSGSSTLDKTFTTSASEGEKEDGTRKEDENFTETIQGKMSGASYAKLIMEYRKTIINIDMMIIDELWDLFMTVY